MDYDLLLSGCCEVARQLLRHGAEIQRAEDTARRILAAYGLEGDVFAIPNCVWVSAPCPDGQIRTVMRRVPPSSVDIEGIERFNDLSRRLCAAPPEDPGDILRQCRQTQAELRRWPVAVCLLGYFGGAFFFALFFSGGWAEAAAA
ncbi:MAG: threonine/serine exporter family protein, partial [Clostridiales bacterium]|nr:threonine/serine exporter family protein [Clostridiales bacterium]